MHVFWWSFRQLPDPGNLITSPTHLAVVLASLAMTFSGLLFFSFIIGISAGLPFAEDHDADITRCNLVVEKLAVSAQHHADAAHEVVHGAVAAGAEARVEGTLRFVLSARSAFLTGQPIPITATAGSRTRHGPAGTTRAG